MSVSSLLRSRVLSRAVGLLGVFLLFTSLWVVGTRTTATRNTQASPQVAFLQAERARLGALVAGPIDSVDLRSAFETQVSELLLAAGADTAAWDELRIYRMAGIDQFDALDNGDISTAVQIAATNGANSSAAVSALVNTKWGAALTKQHSSRVAGVPIREGAISALMTLAGLLLAGSAWQRNRSGDESKLARALHEPAVITDAVGTELAKSAAFIALLKTGGRPERGTLPDLIPPVQLSVARGAVTAVLATGEPWSIEWDDALSGNSLIRYELTLTRVELGHAGSNRNGAVWTIRDVTEQRGVEADLIQRAYHDPLTGLANRALFRDLVAEALRLRETTGSIISVLFIDLDGFKNVNDSLGHDAGDELIKEMANRLRSLVRTNDRLARLGGDEFAVLIEDPRSKLADFVAERILEAIRRPTTLNGQEIFVGASVGIAEAVPGSTTEDLLRNADTAMYAAKDNGKDRVVRFHTMMFREAADRLELDADLRRAIDNNELQLQYQPIIALSDRRMVGVEALVRWFHPERGLISPSVFIPIAEESGAIVQIGRWVLRTAIRQVAELARGDSFTVHVNVSPRQLNDDRLVDYVADELSHWGLPPECLTLEITETTFLENIDAAVARLENLRALGIELSVDDFGTGYSSLSYLQRLPVQSVKIDQSFIVDRSTTEALDSDPFVSAILDLTRNLGFVSIAEGVESEAQAQWLTEQGCDCAQGYYFSRPVGFEALRNAMSTQAKDIVIAPTESLSDVSSHPIG